MRYTIWIATALIFFDGCCSKQSITYKNRDLPKQQLWTSTLKVPPRAKIDRPLPIKEIVKNKSQWHLYKAVKGKQLKKASITTQEVRNALDERDRGLGFYNYQAKELNKILGY